MPDQNPAPETQPIGREMPNSINAERAVISAVLRDVRLLSDFGTLTTDDFYLVAHRALWDAIRGLSDRAQVVDAVTLAEELHRRGRLEMAGGAAYIGDLIDYLGTTVGARSYVAIVQDCARKRRIIDAGRRIAETGYDPAVSADDLAEQAERSVFQAAGDIASDEATPLRDCVRIALHGVEEAAKARLAGAPVEQAVSTGLRDLDALIVGLEPGLVYLLAARPRVGKTALATRILRCRAEGGAPAVLFTLEQPKDQIAKRIIADEAGVDLLKLRKGDLTNAEWSRVSAAACRLHPLPFLIDDRRGLSVSQIRTSACRLAARGQCGVIAIDYVNRMRASRPGMPRHEQVAEFSYGIQNLAGELKVPILLLAQLNRECEKRPDKRPMLSDLKESGSLEEDAHVVLFLYRDDVYNPHSRDKGTAELIVAKQKNGPGGTVRLAWHEESTSFRDYSPATPEGPAPGAFDAEDD